jgi:hypothetical protein
VPTLVLIVREPGRPGATASGDDVDAVGIHRLEVGRVAEGLASL